MLESDEWLSMCVGRRENENENENGIVGSG
jgi:hypothetical protein